MERAVSSGESAGLHRGGRGSSRSNGSHSSCGGNFRAPRGCSHRGRGCSRRVLNKHKKNKRNEIAMQDPNRKKLDEVLPPRMIIQYSDLKLGREIGSGDFGKVYEGRWQNAQVAVKVNTEGDWSNFYNEADLML